MPKFTVQVQEVCTYEVEVRALSKRHAEALAIEAMVQAENINDFFVSCDERDAIDVTPDNKLFVDAGLEPGVRFPLTCWLKEQKV